MTDITMRQGNDLKVVVSVTDQAGDPVDISGASEITWAVSESVDSETTILEKRLSLEEILQAGVTAFSFEISSAESAAIEVGIYYHEALVVTADDKAYTTLSGQFTITDALLQPE